MEEYRHLNMGRYLGNGLTIKDMFECMGVFLMYVVVYYTDPYVSRVWQRSYIYTYICHFRMYVLCLCVQPLVCLFLSVWKIRSDGVVRIPAMTWRLRDE